MPKPNIVTILQKDGRFNTLLTLLAETPLNEGGKKSIAAYIAENQGWTIFAPTDAAFARLDPLIIDGLAKDKKKLRHWLLSHAVKGEKVITSRDIEILLAQQGTISQVTCSGKELCIYYKGSSIYVQNAKVIETDKLGENGIIHVIHSVIDADMSDLCAKPVILM
jgi:transforming growth factor-beta-induced protein